MSPDSLDARARVIGETFLEQYDRQLTAAGTVLVVVVLLIVVDRFFRHRAEQLTRGLAGGELDPVARTRLRFVRRLIAAIIVIVGLATALSQFAALDRFAASVLASTAFIVAVVGFAAQQTLGNAIAGLSLAITQPIRIGDRVAFEDHSGVVEDIRLTHTYLQTGGDARVIVPNGRLAQSVLRNDSIVTDTVAVEVELWLATASDELRAVDAIAAGVPGASADIKAVTHEGTTLVVAYPPSPPMERAAREAELRRACLEVLRCNGLR